MPLYKVIMDYGFAGCYEEDEIEANSEDEAIAAAYEQMQGNLSVGIIEIGEDEENG